ncbi:unannotated protein [freshwater metagenome]|jgi:hypothetical protein|uniref:Unannotated protein n=1 Tax=freshwater metagenome TaxID=449393 RepID=A0A6J7FSM7_9ZZZZ
MILQKPQNAKEAMEQKVLTSEIVRQGLAS